MPTKSLEARAIGAEIAALQRRIAVLERAPRLRDASIEDTVLPVHDADGTVRTKIGVQDDGTFTVIDLNAPPPPVPTAATIEERGGVLVVTWDGAFFGGAPTPLDLDHVEVHVSTVSGYVTTDATELTTMYSPKGESVTLALPGGVTHYVRLQAVNTSGVESAASAEVAGTPAAVEVGAGGVKTYRENDAPVGLGAADDGALWYETDNGNLQHRWSGLALDWIPMPLGTGGIADGAVDSAKLQDGAVTAIKAAFTARDIGSRNVYRQPDAPANPLPGDTWYNTANQNEPRWWDGANWLGLRDATIAAASAAAANAQTSANDALTAAQAAQAAADGEISTHYSDTAPWTTTGATESAFNALVPESTSTTPYSLGTRLRVELGGQITALRFWRNAADSPNSRSVRLYRGDGTLLASANTNEAGAADGWFQAALPAPVDVSAGDEIVAVFDTPGGNWRYNAGSPVSDTPNLTWMQGQYQSGTGAYPANSSTSFYFTDVVLVTSSDPSKIGDLWFRTTDNQAFRWTGTEWAIVTDNAVAEALAAAQTAQTTADGKITAWYRPDQPWFNGDPNHADDAGDLWYDTDAGNKPYYYTGSAWTALPVGLSALQQAGAEAVTARNLGAITTWFQNTDPGSAAKPFDLWVDTTPVANGAGGALVAGNVLKRRNTAGTGWDPMQDTGISKAIRDAAGAQGTADGKVRTFSQATAPTGMTATDDGDLWIDTANGNVVKRWTGSAWTTYTVGTAALDNLAVTDAKVATGQNASKITVGTLSANVVTIKSDLGTDTDSQLLLDATGLRVYGDDGSLTVNIDASGKMATTGSFTTSTVPNEAQIDIGDLAGTGAQRTFINFYLGDERNADGTTKSGYAPGKLEAGWSSGGTASTGGGDQRYIRIVAPNDPSRSVGSLEIRSSNALGGGDRPTLGWTGDIKLEGSRGILTAEAAGNRTRMDIKASQLWLDIPNGVVRVDDGTGRNRIVSRNNDDTAYRPLIINAGGANPIQLDTNLGIFTFTEDSGLNANTFMSRTAGDGADKDLKLRSQSMHLDFPNGSVQMRGHADVRFQIYNAASGASGVGLAWLTGTSALRVTPVNPNFYNAIQASAFTVNSDPQHKTNVRNVALADAWRTVRNLKAYEYERTDAGHSQRGLMSTDLKREAPIVVQEDDCVDLYGLSTTQLVVLQEVVRRLLALEKATGNNAPTP